MSTRHHIVTGLLTSAVTLLGALSHSSAEPTLCLEGFDSAPPQLEQARETASHDLAPAGLLAREGWTRQWRDVEAMCGVQWADDCTPQSQLITAITQVSSSDPAEEIVGHPGLISSDRILVDAHGFLVDLDPAHGPRDYTFTISAVDAEGNRAQTTCTVAVEALTLHEVSPTAGGLKVVYTKSFDACVTVEHQRAGARGPELCASGERVSTIVPVPGDGPVQLCHAGDRRACTAAKGRAPTMASAAPLIKVP